MSRWFRHYAGMVRDEKLVRVSLRSKQPVERVVWIWGAILESAAEINDNGRFDVEPAEVARFLGTDEGDIRSIFDALAESGRLASGVVVKWGDRQFQSDKSATRQAAHRKRKKECDGGVGNNKTSRDGVVTATSRHSDAPETETETETEKKEPRVTRDDSEFEEWYRVYPKREARGQAVKAYWTARKSTDRETLLAGAQKAKAKYAGSEPKFIPLPATWLNGQRWLDEPAKPPQGHSYRDGII